MRMARNKSGVQLTLLGSREAVNIGPGSVVDLDRVIGESGSVPLTIRGALGPHITHFEVLNPEASALRQRGALKGANKE